MEASVNKSLLLLIAVILCTSAAVSQRGMSDYEGKGEGIGPGDCRPISGLGTPDRVFALKPELARWVEKLTDEPSAEKACNPIGDVGECLIAAHASQILQIKFDCVRSALVGSAPLSTSHCPAGTGHKKTGQKKADLKKTIAELAPASDAAAVVKEAIQQTSREVCLP